MTAVRVRAPASTANLGPGFDCAAVALDLWNELEVTDGDGELDLDHLGVRAFARLAPVDGRRFAFVDRIPRERGLGSSAAVIALGLVAAAAAERAVARARRSCLPRESSSRATRTTWPPRSPAASASRGTRGSRDSPTTRRPFPIALVPEATVSTAAARAALPEHGARTADAAFTSATRRAARGGARDGLTPTSSPRRSPTACTSRTAPRARRSWQPCARSFPPAALGSTLSGSGPTVIVWARPESARACAQELEARFPDVSVLTLSVSPRRSACTVTTNPYSRDSDPAKRHSAALTDGPDRAGARSMLKGTGFTDDDLAKPIIGVATTWIETMPCNLNQRDLAVDVKRGIREAGATPMEFNTIAVSDGVSMGTSGMRASLVSREVIADSIELVARGHLFDGLVCLVACDKTTPGAVMALGRLDIPGRRLLHGLDRAGAVPRSRGVDRRRLRGDRRVRGREDERRGAARARDGRVPRRRSLRRPVHRQHDVHDGRLPRPEPARARTASRR